MSGQKRERKRRRKKEVAKPTGLQLQTVAVCCAEAPNERLPWALARGTHFSALPFDVFHQTGRGEYGRGTWARFKRTRLHTIHASSLESPGQHGGREGGSEQEAPCGSLGKILGPCVRLLFFIPPRHNVVTVVSRQTKTQRNRMCLF